MNRALVLLSGGIDSAAALAWTSRTFDAVIAISFEYHLRPFQERISSYRLLQHYPATLIDVPLPFLKEVADANAALAGSIPEGYVPNRNLIFYSIAAHYAEIHECRTIVGGHTAEDREAFPDASFSFFERLQDLANSALLLGKIRIELPLIRWSKLEVLKKAVEWNVPLQHTWSCYWDQTTPCLRCVSCLERAAAFASLGIADPLLS